MEEFENKPDYAKPEEIHGAIGKILWGKKGKKFTMGKLIMGFLKKRIFGGKRK